MLSYTSCTQQHIKIRRVNIAHLSLRGFLVQYSVKLDRLNWAHVLESCRADRWRHADGCPVNNALQATMSKQYSRYARAVRFQSYPVIARHSSSPLAISEYDSGRTRRTTDMSTFSIEGALDLRPGVAGGLGGAAAEVWATSAAGGASNLQMRRPGYCLHQRFKKK